MMQNIFGNISFFNKWKEVVSSINQQQIKKIP